MENSNNPNDARFSQQEQELLEIAGRLASGEGTDEDKKRVNQLLNEVSPEDAAKKPRTAFTDHMVSPEDLRIYTADRAEDGKVRVHDVLAWLMHEANTGSPQKVPPGQRLHGAVAHFIHEWVLELLGYFEQARHDSKMGWQAYLVMLTDYMCLVANAYDATHVERDEQLRRVEVWAKRFVPQHLKPTYDKIIDGIRATDGSSLEDMWAGGEGSAEPQATAKCGCTDQCRDESHKCGCTDQCRDESHKCGCTDQCRDESRTGVGQGADVPGLDKVDGNDIDPADLPKDGTAAL